LLSVATESTNSYCLQLLICNTSRDEPE